MRKICCMDQIKKYSIVKNYHEEWQGVEGKEVDDDEHKIDVNNYKKQHVKSWKSMENKNKGNLVITTNTQPTYDDDENYVRQNFINISTFILKNVRVIH